MKSQTTSERNAQIQKRHAAGESRDALAIAFGLSPNTVYMITNKRPLRRASDGLDPFAKPRSRKSPR